MGDLLAPIGANTGQRLKTLTLSLFISVLNNGFNTITQNTLSKSWVGLSPIKYRLTNAA